MIESIKLENFKAFKNSGYIDMKKINILVGPNSSGKSSFIKSLLILKNSIKSKESSSALTLGKDMGNFNSIVFNKNSKSMFSYRIKLKNENNFKISGKINLSKDLGFNLFAITKQIINKRKDKDEEITSVLTELMKENFKYDIDEVYISLKETANKRIVVENFKMNFSNGEHSEIYRKRNSYYIKFNETNIKTPNVVKPNKFYFFIDANKLNKGLTVDELKYVSILDYVLMKFEKKITRFFNKMIHLKPLRNEFERLEYVTNLSIEESVGEKGENTLKTLLGIENNDKKEIKVNVKNDINNWLDKFDLGKSIDIVNIGNDNYSLEIKNKYTGIKNNIIDVGVGTAQLLPILIESINSKEGSLLIIEEPETHIHPKAQSLLADLFVECASKKDKKFILETHSIFLIIKLQILVAKGIISPKDIGIYYFEQSEKGTITKEMVLNKNGQFDEEWPSGFFDIHYGLGSELIKYM
ncbi:DUF3696 domain-containing protein [Clostridium perfringens]|uniref:DUF3696 domain-containing protein n=2 Tax=Clostridium perfringens TaxID=1502 RepID=UPI002AC43853|nr:DUF3696 domain-containing protein [Clostridium perfringens]MDZ5044099.1 DUF3696 domain-containing protein [Clostridium perfringens]